MTTKLDMINFVSQTEANLYLAKHGLTAAAAYVAEHNPSNDIPYHNQAHLFTVTKWCGRLAGMLGLSVEEERPLILAAIFHDFDHSGGKLEDSENIERAVAGLNKFCDIHFVSNSTRDAATQIIRVTEYPFIHEPQTTAQKIIRDADLLQSIEPNFEEVLVEGLRKELEVKFQRKLSRSEFCEKQVEFLQGVKFYTTQAEVIFYGASVYLVDLFNAIAESSKRKRV